MKPKSSKPSRDVVTNAHRVFGELIERSEQPPKHGQLKIAPPTSPSKKKS